MSSLPVDTATTGLAVSSHSLDDLRAEARTAPDKALKAAAQQFEAVFLNMMLKSMRDATPQDGMLDSEQTKMFTGMLDQQLAQDMASRGIGLADVMVRQLSRHTVVPPRQAGAAASDSPVSGAATSTRNAVPSAYNESTQQDFVQRMTPYAVQASRDTGVPPHLMLSQAALESGWGRREIRTADGGNSYNLFGIKATGNWNGKVANVVTTEYRNGVARKEVQKFRAYDSYAEAFSDYAHLMRDNPRYAPALQPGQSQAATARAVQRAGYATDPNYADKLARVMSRISTAA